ncbi:MAG: M60 family metallopeptidase [Alistipes sp.]|nr:M60 family metallopeptidase [Alistipes sp.]
MKDIMKKRSFKRKAAFLLALSMVCSFPQAINAGAVFADIAGAVKNSPPASDESEAIVPADVIGVSAAGKIDVSMTSALLLENSVEFTVTLTDAYGEVKEETLSIGGSEEKKISFNDLVDGEYTIEVNAPGFAAYQHTIDVKQKLYSVRLTAGFCEGYTYEQGGLHPGVLMVGDVDGNGKVDDSDKDILVNKIDGIVVEEDNYTDLNYDSSTDLTDLTLLAESYREDSKYTGAYVEEFISPASIKADTTDENTTITGSLEEVLAGEGILTITPAGGGEISEENPVTIGFDFSEEDDTVVDGITFETGSENPVSDADIAVTYIGEDGEEHTETVPMRQDVDYLLMESNAYASVDENGNIHVHLGTQIAVKKVTLKIVGMQNNNNLAEISKVEFVNGMESRIPEPEMDIPTNLQAKAGSEQFVISWEPCMNVKGYEVTITQGTVSETVNAVTNSMVVTSFGGDEIKNYTTYNVSVQSVNGSWKSGYCESVDVTPKPNKRPDKPDNVSATGDYKSVIVGWKNMNDTQSYNVYYRLRDSDDEYTKICGIKGTTHTIINLENATEYEIYVTGVNELGESPASLLCSASTSDLSAAEMPRYNMINRDENGVPGSSHIIAATRSGGSMTDSKLDEGNDNTAWGTVDNDPYSYYSKGTWDDGGYNALGTRGLTYTFDQAYKLDTIAWWRPMGSMNFTYQQIQWWDENNVAHLTGRIQCVQTMKDANGRVYYMLKLPYAINAKKIQIAFAHSLASINNITVSEVYFYHYDELYNEIMALYVDDLHTVLKDEVTQETIDELRAKVNTPDEFGEENFNKAALLKELLTAEKILNDEKINSAIEIHNGITTVDTGRGFSGLNAWQPLGVSLPAGEQITVYVGHNTKKTGDSTNLRLICTQYNSESNALETSGANLLVGANTFTIPKGAKVSSGYEAGGALYIQYQANNANDRYSVRVSGGTEVPILDLYNVTDEEQRMERAVEYVEKLDKFVPDMEALHDELHANSTNRNVKFAYDRQNCILGASDILLDTMMLSLPAPQILAGLGNGTVEERAEKLVNSMTAMEDMMYLFYQHKGLNASAPTDLNRIPKGHLNIRYQRMFSGAFMYASGNHIGIGWGSSSSLAGGVPIVSDEDGKYVSGNYFGWGIAHEIGHCINQNTYVVAEITNNYFAQLAQAKDTNAGMRFQYQNIYNKVTSGTKGNCPNIATQLGMYWQLHLAYDSGLNYKTYSNYNDQLNNLFYARVDTYSRNPDAAPAPGGVKLTLGGGTDQNLMRLACAAANKDVLEFFRRWGKTPDSATIAYASQFEKETRAIFFANDDSRVYALNGTGSVLGTDCSVSAIEDVSISIGKTANQVELGFTPADIPESDILGYEIIRCTISGGEIEEIPVGFSTTTSFTDTVTTMNNRAVFYKVTLIDQYLNRSASFTTKMVKIEHDGSMDKKNWTISVDGLNENAVVSSATEEMPCDPIASAPAEKAIDNDLNTAYTPQFTKDSAEIILNFNKTVTATGLKYTAGEGQPASVYEAYVLIGKEWILAAEGTFHGSETVYFANDDDKYISTYSTDAVKLVLTGRKGETVSIAEIDVLAPTGDNVDFRRAGEEKAVVIGTLSSDYKYGDKDEDVIPGDSLVFTGSYKGSPAYNVVILYDGDGNIVGGIEDDALVAQQIILADVPEAGNIANVSDGTWIYWIEPEQLKKMQLPETVRVELYRVNNALTNEGQRLVSDSLFEDVPETLPDITFGK